MEQRIRPKGDFLNRATWTELYTLTEHWSSDLDFYLIELHFLRDLINKYFIWLSNDENIENVQHQKDMVIKMEKRLTEVSDKIKKHLGHLEELMENAFTQDEQIFRDEHALLEDQIVEFTKSFRNLKKEVFVSTSRVLEEEHLNHLIDKA
jgi:hypothetical protein